MIRSPKTHIARLDVRYSESDQMGVVHHAVFIQYFEVGRTRMMADHGLDYAKMEQNGVLLAVIEANVQYLRPARFGDRLSIATRVTLVDKIRVRFHYQVCRDDDPETVLCRGWTLLAAVNRELRPIRMPAQARQVMEDLLQEPPSERRLRS